MIPRTPLDSWIASQTHRSDRLDPDLLRNYQLRALNETIAWAVGNSPFYRERLDTFSESGLGSLDDLSGLPIMDARDLGTQSLRILCISQGDVERVVTLRTSGSTAEPKRVFFTAEDIEHTKNFFAVGMSQMVAPGDTLLVLMPGAAPHSVGDLLKSALTRLDAPCNVYGFVDDPAAVAERIIACGASVLVGLPGQMLALARDQEAALRSRISAVLLSGEHAPPWLTRDIATRLGCEVFVHFGLTETGLGGGVECRAHHGLHLREADLLFEIVDPQTRTPVPDGEAGEIVITTLRRRGMPLIRYATGDAGLLLGRDCPCGSRVQRLLPLGARIHDYPVSPGLHLSMHHVDEAVFRAEGVSACHATLHVSAWPDTPDSLALTLAATSPSSKNIDTLETDVRTSLLDSPDIGPLLQDGSLHATIAWTSAAKCLALSGPKRMLTTRTIMEPQPCPN